MSFDFNSNTISTDADNIYFNGNKVHQVFMNTNEVWFRKEPAGSETFTANGNFIVPVGITEVTICLSGGGGGGAAYSSNSAGGGYSGQIVTQAVSGLTAGQSIPIVIGTGGSGGLQPHNGYAGTESSFDTIANGAYLGNGALRSSCGGDFNDGIQSFDGFYYGRGGQAGAFGDGGDGGTSTGVEGGVSADGGGGTYNTGGNGGRGQCVVSWL